MDDRELDNLFKEAIEKFSPPDAPEGAWDRFVQERMSDSRNKQKDNWIGVFFGKMSSFLMSPKYGWRIAVAVLVVAIGLRVGIKELAKLDKDVKVGNWVTNINPQFEQLKTVPRGSFADSTGGSINNLANTGKPMAADTAITTLNKELDAIQKPGVNSSVIYQGVYLQNKQIVVGMGQKPKSLIAKDFLTDSTDRIVFEGKNRNPDNGKISEEPKVAILANPLADISSVDRLRKAMALERKGNRRIVPGTDDHVINRPAQSRSVLDNFPLDENEDIKRKWQLGVVGGSNISYVGGTISKKPGVNAGLMARRKIGNSRLSVESGIVVESMEYNVANADFRPGGKDVSNAVSNISGTCTMVDIPVNIRYDVVRSKENSAFVSTGVSAVLMTSQDYSYQYSGEYGNSQVNKDVSGQGNTVYATTNVSVGFERQFKRTAVQLAPYLKIPLGTIGYGDLKIGNIGAQISIKQSF